MNKKSLLFVNESLNLAGGERSLVTLLSNIDPEKFDIDLQLIRYGGTLDSLIPPYVNVLPEMPYPKFSKENWINNIFKSLKKSSYWKFLLEKFKFSFKLRKKKYTHPEIAQLYWESTSKCYNKTAKTYDVAIAYAQGVPTFYVADKVSAKKKLAWVNVSIKMNDIHKRFLYNYYSFFDLIVPVSQATLLYMQKELPEYKDKMVVIRDMINYKFIKKMSLERDLKLINDAFKILTVARLNKHQKGYDIALNACKILSEKKINFHWYVIGEGPYKKEMMQFIKVNDLEHCFSFLGTTPNPYPFFVEADLYVQTSRHEGYGLSIAEARLLNTPVVTTNYDTVHMQMKHEKNGLITEMNPEAVAEGIIRMMEDKSLYKDIVSYLENEEKEDLEPLHTFYSLLN